MRENQFQFSMLGVYRRGNLATKSQKVASQAFWIKSAYEKSWFL